MVDDMAPLRTSMGMCAIRPQQTKNVLVVGARPRGHLVFSASELLVGGPSKAWPLPYAVFLYCLPSCVIFVVHPVFHVIMAALPSSFQVPVIPSPRVAFATPSLDKVLSLIHISEPTRLGM